MNEKQSEETGATHASNKCRFCGSKLGHTFVDLGMSPLCQTHIAPEQLNDMEPFYPLHAYVCDQCYLVQLNEYVTPENIFSEYAYFSSYSDSWVEHAKKYAHMMADRFNLDKENKIMEIASNDGYLLQHFVQNGYAVLGIEPAANVAKVAVEKGIPTITRFFGKKSAQEIRDQYGRAQLLLGNNVLAHVPDINDFVAGMKEILMPDGVITMEFPHLMRLMEFNQFDTIYHEHFSYLSCTTVEKIFAAHGLTLFDVEELPTHGGSLRIFAKHDNDTSKAIHERLTKLKKAELNEGVDNLQAYSLFEEKVKETKRKILEFFITAKRQGKSIAGYGAPGKGNTLLNYCGIRQDFIDYTVDRNPYKQGKYTPGTHIPILPPERIRETKPDYIFILPWNLKDEIVKQLSYVKEWGGKFVVPIPEVTIIEN